MMRIKHSAEFKLVPNKKLLIQWLHDLPRQDVKFSVKWPNNPNGNYVLVAEWEDTL